MVVKVLREDRGSPGARERFLREARLAAQLRHPYAAQVYASGAALGGSLLWIAMELVHGVSLAEWMEQHGRMPPEQFVPFFDHVCQVVHALHDRRIVHRDFTPSNIMVVESGDRLTPKLSRPRDRPGELAASLPARARRRRRAGRALRGARTARWRSPTT